MHAEQQDIERAILRTLYDGWFRNELIVHLRDIRDENGWDQLTYDKAVATLVDHAFIGRLTGNDGCKVLSQGIIYVEKQGIASAEEASVCSNLRTQLLALLGELYDKQGSFAWKHFQELATDLESDDHLVLHNLDLLKDCGLVEAPNRGSYKLTRRGIEAVAEWRQQSALAQELEEISQLTPQPRGRALQKLFAKTVAQEGWIQAEGVRTSHEELDVIVSRSREYYLVECKWERKSIGAPVVRELHGKLSNRVDVRGILLSMSGFASTAVEQVEDYAGSKVILLFGQEDVRSIIHQQTTFEELLNEKYGKLATKRKVVFK